MSEQTLVAISLIQWQVLRTLRRYQRAHGASPRQREISAELQIAAPMVSQHLNQLARDGWLTLQHDGRRAHYELTQAAVKRLRTLGRSSSPPPELTRPARPPWNFHRARRFVRALKLRSQDEYARYMRRLPEDGPQLPQDPSSVYARSGWQGWQDFLHVSRTRKSSVASAATRTHTTVIEGLTKTPTGRYFAHLEPPAVRVARRQTARRRSQGARRARR